MKRNSGLLSLLLRGNNDGCKFISLILLFALFLLYLYTIFFLISASFEGRFIQFGFLIIAVILLALLISIPVLFFTETTPKLNNDRLECVTLSGRIKKVVELNEIISWEEVVKDGSVVKLLLFTKKGKVKIEALNRSFNEIRNVLKVSVNKRPGRNIF